MAIIICLDPASDLPPLLPATRAGNTNFIASSPPPSFPPPSFPPPSFPPPSFPSPATHTGNRYVNFLLISLAELPAAVGVVLVIDRIGRIPILLAGLVAAGLACILCGLVAGVVQVRGLVLGGGGRELGWCVLGWRGRVLRVLFALLLSNASYSCSVVSVVCRYCLLWWGSSGVMLHGVRWWSTRARCCQLA